MGGGGGGGGAEDKLRLTQKDVQIGKFATLKLESIAMHGKVQRWGYSIGSNISETSY